jgi:GxxExxY protein
MTITSLTKRKIDDSQTYDIIGAAMEVHRILGCGFLESVYREAFSIELHLRGIPFVREVLLPIEYRGQLLRVGYRIDFMCFESVLVEIKALPALGKIEHAQAVNYLRASKRERGLLLNFGGPSLEYKRVVSNVNVTAAETGKVAQPMKGTSQ